MMKLRLLLFSLLAKQIKHISSMTLLEQASEREAIGTLPEHTTTMETTSSHYTFASQEQVPQFKSSSLCSERIHLVALRALLYEKLKSTISTNTTRSDYFISSNTLYAVYLHLNESKLTANNIISKKKHLENPECVLRAIFIIESEYDCKFIGCILIFAFNIYYSL